MGIKQTLESMTIEEKIGQKIMLDFRYWDPAGKATLDMTQPDDTIKTLILDHHIGGVILFANNLKDRDQIARLTSWYASLETSTGLRLFIATDNEGGNVFRLPRGEYASFSGNMALSAAIEGGADRQLAYEQGKQMAQDMKSLHINTNFAPVVDVNANPANPVINVRAFSDDAATIADLAQRMKDDAYLSYLRYAASQGKTRVHLSLRAPYDVVNYAEFVDAAVASYSFYGYENGVWRGRSMTSLAEVLIGNRRPAGKLPVNTWKRYDSQTYAGAVAQPKGFGLSW
ncbi:glycoside hydrolase family 3 N-terminal domain-containing protein [Pseudomonas sp. MWU12-2345]|uniref:glycoside hydrolase family 3 N-terminal domain-containing protein n=1 Tax=Pseudomonas sp. MWU12-2345 TaxID=2928689 RepID=UPI002010604F|nr:glycoside hydrolase family 3 N-terminal domain-containing protein [Pseudomonas sp. MWU12-2345]